MNSGFLGHPTRAPHRVDQLEDAGHKPGRTSDAFAVPVPVPTRADHSENDAEPDARLRECAGITP